MRLLVTGGAGFIGSNFIRYMINNHPTYEIVNLDLLTYAGNIENVKDFLNYEGYSFVYGDIKSNETVTNIVKNGVDVIVNFAAESHVDRSIVNPALFVQTNVLGTQNLLEVARKYHVKRFIQISTDEVYGTLGKSGLFTENTPLAPNSPYSASKAGADLLVRAYHETFNMPVNITRCSNNYGPYQFPEKLIPLMIINALEGDPLPIYGDGLNIRDWLHVKDHCSAIDAVIHRGVPGEIYNIGCSNERTNMEIVKTIVHELGKSEELIKFVDDRLGHDRRYGIDPSKIMSELGWKPEYSFKVGIHETIQWYLNNRLWWVNIKNNARRPQYVPL